MMNEIKKYYKEEVERLTSAEHSLMFLERSCASSINCLDVLKKTNLKHNDSVKEIESLLLKCINHINKLKQNQNSL